MDGRLIGTYMARLFDKCEVCELYYSVELYIEYMGNC